MYTQCVRTQLQTTSSFAGGAGCDRDSHNHVVLDRELSAEMALSWPRAGHFNRALLNASTNTLLASTSYNVYASDGHRVNDLYR
jgi:hypothetical protein